VTSDEFIAWAMAQPEGEHYELLAGEVVAVAPQRVSHALAKGRVQSCLADAVEAARLRCDVFPGGMAIVVDGYTTYEPDVSVRCGPTLDDDAVKITDPVIVVKVLSPSARGVDVGSKIVDYFRLPSVRHCLVFRVPDRTVVHHARGGDGAITARTTHGNAPITLDPPGITLRDFWE
jgi:Uma2 family endonuclease